MRMIPLSVKDVLEGEGFTVIRHHGKNDVGTWYARGVFGVPLETLVRLAYKAKLNVVTLHIGWRNAEVHAFCVKQLQSAWPEGHVWLQEIGLVSAPCMTQFNLADVAGLGAGALWLNADRESQLLVLRRALRDRELVDCSLSELLARYLADRKPFSWAATNAAIRAVEIAGIIRQLGLPSARSHFSEVIGNHREQIAHDMYGRGVPDAWIEALEDSI